jgi:toxin HigB-1
MLNMIGSFKNDGTEDIFNGLNSKAARKICPESIWRVAVRKLDQIDSVTTIDELAVPPGNHLEKLTADSLTRRSTNEMVNTAFASTTNIAFALNGLNQMPNKSKSLITTKFGDFNHDSYPYRSPAHPSW